MPGGGKGKCPGFLTRRALKTGRSTAQVLGPGRGAVVVFEGRVRDREGGVPISAITYEAYPIMAERELARICRQAQRRWKVAVCLRHRIGRVPAGQPAVVIACAGRHRGEAFCACRFIIDAVKARVPIWKTEFCKKRAK